MNTLPDIFLSYNREDHFTARRFAEAFEAQGFNVWWDATLRSGEAYDEVTEKALRDAKAVVVLWSKRSVVSRWVRSEATVADRNKTLVPVMIEPCEWPIMFELTQTAELAHWTGAAEDKAWQAFLSDVRRFVEKDPVPAQPVPAIEPTAPLTAVKPGERGDTPSLAVLPFTNRSGLPEDEVFAIGMVEDVIDALSQGINVRVIASSATARFRTGAIPDLDAMARQLGVRYLLEGNVRRTGADLRVTAQLVEAASGEIVWTQRFERPLSELAALQEDLVVEVAAHLNEQVYQLEMARALKKPADLTAWEALTRGYAAYREMTAQSMLVALEDMRRAIAIAPDYGLAHAWLASALGIRYFFFSPDDDAEVRRIREHADRALALDPESAAVLTRVALALNYIEQTRQALHLAERAIGKDSGNANAHICAAIICAKLNRIDDALKHVDVAITLLPGSHILYTAHYGKGMILTCADRWSEAEAVFDKSLALNPHYAFALVAKAVCCHREGRQAEVRDGLIDLRQSSGVVTLAQFETHCRRWYPAVPARDEFVAHLRALWAATEPAA